MNEVGFPSTLLLLGSCVYSWNCVPSYFFLCYVKHAFLLSSLELLYIIPFVNFWCSSSLSLWKGPTFSSDSFLYLVTWSQLFFLCQSLSFFCPLWYKDYSVISISSIVNHHCHPMSIVSFSEGVFIGFHSMFQKLSIIKWICAYAQMMFYWLPSKYNAPCLLYHWPVICP